MISILDDRAVPLAEAFPRVSFLCFAKMSNSSGCRTSSWVELSQWPGPYMESAVASLRGDSPWRSGGCQHVRAGSGIHVA